MANLSKHDLAELIGEALDDLYCLAPLPGGEPFIMQGNDPAKALRCVLSLLARLRERLGGPAASDCDLRRTNDTLELKRRFAEVHKRRGLDKLAMRDEDERRAKEEQRAAEARARLQALEAAGKIKTSTLITSDMVGGGGGK